LNKLFDLGSWWNEKTNGLPVPLGINVASSRFLSSQQIIEFDNILKRSIEYGLENLEEAVEFSTKYGRNTSKDILTKFIKMYVNDFTIDMKEAGKNSISTLFHLAKLNGIFDKSPKILYSN
jgi:1,4-dihydroxy-6-naphthoate synthase